MTWHKDAEARKRDAKTYGAEYRRNREVARRRANGVCEGCRHRHARLECDHITPATQDGTDHPNNLRMLCKGAGTCRCHEKKTATEGNGYRRPGRRGDIPVEDPTLTPRTKW